MNEGHTSFFIALGNPHLDSFAYALNDVGRACDVWLRKRGLLSREQRMHAEMMRRRKERSSKGGQR